MSDSGFQDHFSAISAAYAAARPVYPAALAQEISALCSGHALALDCGCGNGQLSTLLARHFRQVRATDASADQIARARSHPRVRYATALAADSGLEPRSVDLVTVAQAAHWLDLPRFYQEVERVARPDAVIALITYGVLHVDGPGNEAVQHFYQQTIAPYWPPERRHVDEGYRNLAFPFAELTLPHLDMQADWTLPQLLAYISTWSAVKKARQILDHDPVARLGQQLRAVWPQPDQPYRITWPLTIRAGRIRR